MSKQNVDLIRSIYDAFATGDIPAVVATMSPDVEWNEAENFPYADNNPYRGPEAVLTGVFGRIATDWQDFGAVPGSFQVSREVLRNFSVFIDFDPLAVQLRRPRGGAAAHQGR